MATRRWPSWRRWRRWPPARSYGARGPWNEAASETVAFPLAGQGPGSGGGHLFDRRRRIVPAHGGGNPRAGSGPSALPGDERELAGAAPRAQAPSNRSRPGDANTRAQRIARRGISAGTAQDTGLQLAVRTPPPAVQSGFVPVLARRAARPYLSAPLVVAVAQARAHAGHQRLSRHGRPRHLARASPRGRALSLFPLSALARRRRPDLQPAARDGARVRRR